MFALSDLYEAIVLVDLKRVKQLVAHDHDIDVNEPFTQFNVTRRRGDGESDNIASEGLTPLTVAAQLPESEAVDIIKVLVKAGTLRLSSIAFFRHELYEFYWSVNLTAKQMRNIN